MTGSKPAAWLLHCVWLPYCVWLLGGAIAITGLMAGLDHWGSYRRFLKRGRSHGDLPVDVVATDPTAGAQSAAGEQSAGSASVFSLRVDADDHAGDEPDEPVGDRLTAWLCDHGGGQKAFGLSISPGDAPWAALAVSPSQRRPGDDRRPATLSLNALNVLLQI